MKQYVIQVRGHLDPSWSTRLSGLVIHNLPSGLCELRGELADQAALYGLLTQIRDLGLELLAVNRVDIQEEEKFNVADQSLG